MKTNEMPKGSPFSGRVTIRGCGLLALVALILVAGCKSQLVSPSPTPPPGETPIAPTPTEGKTSPTPAVTETPPSLSPTASLEASPTSSSVPPTATSRLPTATSVPPPAPPTPTAKPTASPIAEASIHTFRANVEVADPGETITLFWEWRGADSAGIYHLFGHQLSEPHWEVGPSGSVEYTISQQARNFDRFVLYLTRDEEGVVAQEMIEVELRCPDEWFFRPAPDICPQDAPIVTDGAEQHFERGTMLWNGAEGRIYVLFNDRPQPEWSAYTDEWEEGDPTMDPNIEPPTGLYQPVRGFGLVWREETQVRERLGWAIDQERGYQMALQRTSHIRYSDLYIRALNGGIWRLGPNGSSWEHFFPGGS